MMVTHRVFAAAVVIFLFCFISSVLQSPMLRPPCPGDYIGIGDMRTITCEDNDENVTRVYWNSTLQQDQHPYNLNLTIPFRRTESQTFKCTSSYDDGKEDEWVTCTVKFAYGPTGPPTIREASSRSEFDLCPASSDQLHLTCQVSDEDFNPRPVQYRFYINSIDLEDTRDNTLIFNSSSSGDTGLANFTCEAWNSEYSNTAFVSDGLLIELRKPPEDYPTITIDGESHSATINVTSGHSDITCTVNGGFPLVSNTTLTCTGGAEFTRDGNNVTETITTHFHGQCNCSAHHVTGCYNLQRVVYINVQNPIELQPNPVRETTATTDVYHNFLVRVLGYPDPVRHVLQFHDPCNQQKTTTVNPQDGSYNYTFNRGHLSANCTVNLTFYRLNETGFGQYTLELDNGQGPALKYNFTLKNPHGGFNTCEGPKEIPVVAIVVPIVVVIIIAAVIIIVVIIVRRRRFDKPHGTIQQRTPVSTDINGPRPSRTGSLTSQGTDSTGPVNNVLEWTPSDDFSIIPIIPPGDDTRSNYFNVTTRPTSVVSASNEAEIGVSITDSPPALVPKNQKTNTPFQDQGLNVYDVPRFRGGLNNKKGKGVVPPVPQNDDIYLNVSSVTPLYSSQPPGPHKPSLSTSHHVTLPSQKSSRRKNVEAEYINSKTANVHITDTNSSSSPVPSPSPKANYPDVVISSSTAPEPISDGVPLSLDSQTDSKKGLPPPVAKKPAAPVSLHPPLPHIIPSSAPGGGGYVNVPVDWDEMKKSSRELQNCISGTYDNVNFDSSFS